MRTTMGGWGTLLQATSDGAESLSKPLAVAPNDRNAMSVARGDREKALCMVDLALDGLCNERCAMCNFAVAHPQLRLTLEATSASVSLVFQRLKSTLPD